MNVRTLTATVIQALMCRVALPHCVQSIIDPSDNPKRYVS